MVDDYRTEHCETCPEWRKRWVITDSPSDKCAYVFPGDHCEYARQKLEESGKNVPLTPEEFAAEMLRLQKSLFHSVTKKELKSSTIRRCGMHNP